MTSRAIVLSRPAHGPQAVDDGRLDVWMRHWPPWRSTGQSRAPWGSVAQVETRTDIGGAGLALVLNDKGGNSSGILNGVDGDEWNPATDALIPVRFDAKSIEGKAACKAALQERMALEVDPGIPLIGVIGRFVAQKGLDLRPASIERNLKTMRVQFAILGTGDKGLEWYFGPMPGRYPGRVGSYIGYNETLAHWIEAGGDFSAMPSRYEPCGLNQIYSLSMGRRPIVRATGGLNDTVRQYDEATGNGTGFKFFEPTAQAVYDTVGWAVSTYYDRPRHMAMMIAAAMAEDFSWERSTAVYEAAYAQAKRHPLPPAKIFHGYAAASESLS